jgi:hypothetical protein
MKPQNTTHFDLWLSAYESRLVELKQGKAPIPKKPVTKAGSKTEITPPKRP